jgi:hypothetical protein
MLITNIHSGSIRIDPETASRIDGAFNAALDRFKDSIRAVEVRLVDLNGPKGGVDKRCSVQVRLYPRGLVVVRSLGASLLEAANVACDKTRQLVARKLDKRLSKRRASKKGAFEEVGGE